MSLEILMRRLNALRAILEEFNRYEEAAEYQRAFNWSESIQGRIEREYPEISLWFNYDSRLWECEA